MRLRNGAFNLIIALAVGTLVLFGQEHHHPGGGEAVSTGNLGQVHFPTSCAPGAQQTFEKGVALLHSFQYEAADQAFKRAATDDPQCAMAYWGEAMSLWHALWDRPDEATLKTGREDLEKASSLNATTAREREYIAAARAFFQDDPKLDYSARTAAYSTAMERLHNHYPGDGEAAAEQATNNNLGDAHYQLHALDFLGYAYLQSGQKAKAEQVIEEVKQVPGATPEEIEDTQVAWRARYALETHDWKMAADLQPPSGALYAQETTWWVRAIGAARAGDVAGARANIEKLAAVTAQSRTQSKKEGYEVKDEKSIDQLDAEAWLTYAEGKKAEALKALTAVAGREDREGVDDLAMPAREMLGDMLMESNQPEAALAAYHIALKESPNRFDALQGTQLAEKASAKEQPAAGGR